MAYNFIALYFHRSINFKSLISNIFSSEIVPHVVRDINKDKPRDKNE